MWDQVGAKSWHWGHLGLVPSDPLSAQGLAALASARVTLGRRRADLSPPSYPYWHCHPATSREDGVCPIPAHASLPLTSRVRVCVSGDSFLCHFK